MNAPLSVEHPLHLVAVDARLGPKHRIPPFLVSGEVPVEHVLAAVTAQRMGLAVVGPATNPSSDIDISITTFVMESLLSPRAFSTIPTAFAYVDPFRG